jgi:hypothetical protein
MQHFLGLAGMESELFQLFSVGLGLWSNDKSVENNPFYGRKHTDKTKLAMSNARKGKPNPNMTRDQSGKNNSFYGRRHSADTRAQMSFAKSGEANPMYGKEGYPERYHFDVMSEHMAFQPGAANPQYKGTFVLDVEKGVQYGPFLKAETLSMFRVSSRKYYEVLNTSNSYKGLMFKNKRPFDTAKYGQPTSK